MCVCVWRSGNLLALENRLRAYFLGYSLTLASLQNLLQLHTHASNKQPHFHLRCLAIIFLVQFRCIFPAESGKESVVKKRRHESFFLFSFCFFWLSPFGKFCVVMLFCFCFVSVDPRGRAALTVHHRTRMHSPLVLRSFTPSPHPGLSHA